MKKRIGLIVIWIASIAVAAWLGANWYKFIYFNDDDEVEKAVLADARRAWPEAEGFHPNYFRTASYSCVRFMPVGGAYAHVLVYCKSNSSDRAFQENY